MSETPKKRMTDRPRARAVDPLSFVKLLHFEIRLGVAKPPVLSAEIGSSEREVRKDRADARIACRTDYSSTLTY